MIGHIPIFPVFDFNNRLFYGRSLCTTCYLFSEEYATWMPDYEQFQNCKMKSQNLEEPTEKGLIIHFLT
jgi:hypothetical protein